MHCIHVHTSVSGFQLAQMARFLLPLKLTSIEHSKMHPRSAKTILIMVAAAV